MNKNLTPGEVISTLAALAIFLIFDLQKYSLVFIAVVGMIAIAKFAFDVFRWLTSD